MVDGQSAWVAGASGVVLFDTRDVIREEEGLGASGVKVTLLGAGDRVDLGTGVVEHGAGKRPWAGPTGEENTFDSDLFRRWGLLAFFVEAGLSSDSEFTFEQDNLVFEFSKSPDFRSLSREGSGVQGAPLGLSVGPMILTFSSMESR